MKKILLTSTMALMLLAGCRDSDINQQDGVEHDFEDMTEEVGPEDDNAGDTEIESNESPDENN